MIELRPPADADNYRVKAGRFGDRFYCDPLPADPVWGATGDNEIYPSISTVKKAVGTDWSRAMAKRLSQSPSQLVEIGNVDNEFERKERINLLSAAGLNKAGDRGNIVHAHAEALLANRLPIYQMTDAAKPYVRTTDAFFAAYQPKQIAVEFVAISRYLNAAGVQRGNEYFGYGGTGDAVVEIDGKYYLVDWKSRPEDGNHAAHPEEGAQVAAYGKADYWIVADPGSQHGAKRIAPPELAGGLIISIKPDSYEVFPIDLDEGFAYWTDMHAWWQALRSQNRSLGRKWAPRAEPSTSQPVEPAAEPVNEQVAVVHDPSPTVTSNRARFNALTEVQKATIRETFKRFGVNPNRNEFVIRVSKLLAEIEQRPSLAQMVETKAEQEAAHPAPPPAEPEIDPLEAEGGPATDEMMAEARLMFDMVLDKSGREWTGFRVKESNEAEVPFQLSKLPSMKRGHLYLALCTWAAWRQTKDDGYGEMHDPLLADEAEGNVEFTAVLAMVDGRFPVLTLGHRLGNLSTEQAVRLAVEIKELVDYESGNNVATANETQPAIQLTTEEG
ncbi:hypothetical protein [Ilumatobacter sp.]|uniref:hypothetical protein n=1 Tax=Ilumatobacter sp. TaxID=1967498 RepID=UPI0037524F96